MTALPAPPGEHWYIAATAARLGRRPLGRTVLGQRLALFRDAAGRPAALTDRCLHRNMALSRGRVVGGCLECPYHGWRYDAAGRCVLVPSSPVDAPAPDLGPLRGFPVCERDGYVWVWLGDGRPAGEPFRFPHLGEAGWTSFRMTTRFAASAFACLENFLDCPHTVFVHRGWFRSRRPRALAARVRRFRDRVEAEFVDERPARSVVSALFFPADVPLCHTDRFLLPAISRVDYAFPPRRHFIITSQCTPVSDHETEVHTVVTFRAGRLGPLVRALLSPICRRIIRQDVVILGRQTAQLATFGGPRFTVVETDLFAPHIRALWAEAAPGPRRRAARPESATTDEHTEIPEIETKVPIRF